MTLERGTQLHGRYRIVEILGQGGMGSVYRAVDENLGVDVAVKENLFTTDEYARQFRLEAVILASLRHPNLPRVSDHFVVGDVGQYLVMDFIEGEDLRQRMDRVGMISDDDAIQIGAAMCDALDYLHARKPSILHRDIKPGNVKITPDGHIFLVDFGLAKVVLGSQATTTGARAMTPGYSPPEQYGTARTDPRTDIYSLGATLYAALSGIIPEDGLARAMDNAQLTPLRKRNPRVSRRLAAAIEKAMAVDPSDRFQSAEDFKKALLNSRSMTQQSTGGYVVAPPPPESLVLADSSEVNSAMELRRATGPLPPPELEEEQPFVSPRKKQQERERRRRRAAVRFLLLLMTVALASVSFLGPDTLNMLPADVRAMIPFLIPAGETTSTHTALPGVSDISTATPALPMAAFTVTGTPRVILTETQPATPTQIGTPIIAPVPNGTPMGGGFGQVAFASNRSGLPQIYLSDLSGENIMQVTNMDGGACQPAWSPDGMKFVFTSPCRGMEEIYPDANLYILNVDGSNLPPTPLPTVPGGDFDPAWSPDGTRIAFTSVRSRKMEIYLFSLADQSVTQLTSHASMDVQSRQPAWSPDGKQIAYTVKRYGIYQIWLMSGTGKDQKQIVRSGENYSDYLPTWSPDGKLILFNQRCATRFCEPYAMSISGEGRTTKIASPVALGPRPIEDLTYSSDGFWIVYEGEEVGENREIVYVTVNGANRRRITNDRRLDFDPAWRPKAAQ